MTSYRTVVPGMTPDGDGTSYYQKPRNPYNNADSDYTRPDMGDAHMNGGTNVNNNYNEPINDRQSEVHGKPIVGFLVSVSRSEVGEYWVLRQGQNTIGSGDSCNICLPESSVSNVHAVLAIHRNPGDGNKLSVGILDKGSSNGTFVNGNYIGFNPCHCQTLDRLKIGNYELVLILFDHIALGLTKSEHFISQSKANYSDRENYMSYENDGTRF